MRHSGTTVLGFGPDDVRSWAARAKQWLADHRGELDTMNVFPVADSDTGTNLYLTFADAAAAVERLGPDASVAEVAETWARGALVGARGNSGVIVGAYAGVLVRSLVSGVGAAGSAAEAMAEALVQAADAAWSAVVLPVEGTVLTVAAEVAAAARGVALPTTPGALVVLEGAIGQGYDALARTTDQLAPLRAAGVLDAGAWGLLLVLDALADVLGSASAVRRAAGRPTPASPGTGVGDGVETGAPGAAGVPDGATGTRPTGTSATGTDCHRYADEHDHGGGEFEVMYLVGDRPDVGTEVTTSGGVPVVTPHVASSDVAAAVRAALARVGESVAVVGGDGLWQAHVHTDRPLAAIAVPATLGLRAHQVRARHLLPRPASDGTSGPGLVAVTCAPGLVADLARAGAVVVLATDGAVGPELARAVEDTGAQRVVVVSSVPVGPAQRTGVEVRAGLTEVHVVAGAATFATLDRHSDTDGVLAEVCDVVEQVRAVRVASREAEQVGGPDGQRGRSGGREGGRRGRGGHDSDADVSGRAHTGPVLAAARELLAGGDGPLTVITGDGTPSRVVDELRAGLAVTHPAADVVLLEGGASHGDVVLGVG